MDLAVPSDYGVKMRQSEKKGKYPDDATELKKLWNMKVIVIPIVIGHLGTINNGLVWFGCLMAYKPLLFI